MEDFDQIEKEVKVEMEIPEIKLETLKELLAEEMPEEEWLIDRVLPAEGFTFIVGAEATGKTFYTMTIADSVVSGKPWLDKFEVTKTTKVLFLDKENSRRRIQGRARGLGIDENGEGIYRLLNAHLFNLLDERGALTKHARELSEMCRSLEIGLVIIDSFTDFMLGNENSSGDVQVFFTAMRQIFPGLAILVLHHENKPSQGVSRTSSQRVRGSTNITAQLVSGFRVFPVPKTQNEFVLEQFKAGDSEKLKPFKVELVTKEVIYKPGKTYVSEVKWNGEYYDEEGKAELAQEMIIGFLEDNPTSSRQEILQYLSDNSIGSRTADSTLREMVEEKLITKIKTGKQVSYILI